MQPSYSLESYGLQDFLASQVTEHFFDFGEWLVLVDNIGNLVGFKLGESTVEAKVFTNF